MSKQENAIIIINIIITNSENCVDLNQANLNVTDFIYIFFLYKFKIIFLKTYLLHSNCLGYDQQKKNITCNYTKKIHIKSC